MVGTGKFNFSGFETHKLLVLQVVLEDHDVSGILHTATRYQLVKYNTGLMEKLLALAKESSYPQIVLIADFKGNNPANLFHKRGTKCWC